MIRIPGEGQGLHLPPVNSECFLVRLLHKLIAAISSLFHTKVVYQRETIARSLNTRVVSSPSDEYKKSKKEVDTLVDLGLFMIATRNRNKVLFDDRGELKSGLRALPTKTRDSIENEFIQLLHKSATTAPRYSDAIPIIEKHLQAAVSSTVDLVKRVYSDEDEVDLS